MTTKNLPAIHTENMTSLLLDVARFEHAQRVGKMLAASTMVPDHFKNNIGNCVIALNFADRVGVDPFMAMQKMYVIHGKPAIETQLAIALVNKSGRYTPIQYKFNEKRDTCIAYATNKETKEVCEGPPVSLQMAKDEGWMSKQGSKWKTLPDLMLRYRAAMFFARTYCPEALLGLYTREEVQEYTDLEESPDGTFAPVAPTEGETLADKVAKKKTAKKKQTDTEPDISADAQADIDSMKAQNEKMYDQAVLQYMKDGNTVSTNEDVDKVVVIFQELMEAEL